MKPGRGRFAVVILLALYTTYVHAFIQTTLHSQTNRGFTLTKMKAEDGNNMKVGPVLVVGATGRMGKFVVAELIDNGYSNIRCLTRDPDSPAAQELASRGQEGGGGARVEVVKGDLCDPTTLGPAVEGCSSCISCSGPSRVSEISDMWTHPSKIIDHPYNVNYIGIKDLVKECKKYGLKKFVRVTGLSVGMEAFSPIPVLLNTAASFAVKWQLYGEMEIRKSGLDYTVVRPGGLDLGYDYVHEMNRAISEGEETGEELSLALADDGGIPVVDIVRIGRGDVASLCVAALSSPHTSKATLGCVWVKGSGPSGWSTLLEAVKPDKTELEPKAHLQAVRVFLTTVAAVITLLLSARISAVVFS